MQKKWSRITNMKQPYINTKMMNIKNLEQILDTYLITHHRQETTERAKKVYLDALIWLDGHINQEIFGDRKLPGHPLTNGDVVIGNDVWIGYGVTIMSGVSIGSGAVIAANSHVIKDVPSYEIWGGNPAQPIRSRFPSEIKERLLEINWWDYSVEKVIEVEELLQQTPSIETLFAIEKILKV